MKLSRTISILAVFLLLITCMMVFAVNIGYAADTTQTAISSAGSAAAPQTVATQPPNLLVEWGGYILTLVLVPAASKFFSWLSKRLTTAKYVPKSVQIWVDQINESDIADAVNEARKLISMIPTERIAWARKYLQDRYKQLPSSVANKLLEDKYQEIVKTPQLIG